MIRHSSPTPDGRAVIARGQRGISEILSPSPALVPIRVRARPMGRVISGGEGYPAPALPGLVNPLKLLMKSNMRRPQRHSRRSNPICLNPTSRTPVRPGPECIGPCGALAGLTLIPVPMRQHRLSFVPFAGVKSIVQLVRFQQYCATARSVAATIVAAGVSMMMHPSHALVAGRCPTRIGHRFFGTWRHHARRRSASGFLRTARNSLTLRPGAGPRTGLKPSSSSPERSSVGRLPTAS